MIVRDEPRVRALGEQFAVLRAAALAQVAPPIALRRAHLAAVERIVTRNVDLLAAAIDADFGHRSRHETQLIELFPVRAAARYAYRRVARWAAPQRRAVAPYFWPGRARLVHQPLGVVGIIAPWNYPVLLALQPLVDALAAGNRVMIKMSEFVPQTAAALAELLHAQFASDHVRVACGGADVARTFAALPFDHLLFTGSTATGRTVMRSAAQHLTPVTLELGGKSPAIIGHDARIAVAASRVMSGKCRNAGQTCVAPDYALVPVDMVDGFVAAARRVVNRRFPELGGNADYSSIASDAHFERVCALLDDASANGARVIPLHDRCSRPDRAARIVPPTIVTDVHDGMRIMREEIFGPLLPVRTYAALDEAIAYVNARPRPLALYYFGTRQSDIATVLEGTTSGGVAINDVVLQFAQNDLPFGGIGASGMGAYHGRAGFERFSHAKAVFAQSGPAGSDLLEPPYGKRFAGLLRLLAR